MLPGRSGWARGRGDVCACVRAARGGGFVDDRPGLGGDFSVRAGGWFRSVGRVGWWHLLLGISLVVVVAGWTELWDVRISLPSVPC
ncbi:hypothetical protein [Streptomyces sp. NPDC005408]|uniref:hypothetical protein n=1 Tax=Streptomyces sp. NPDC005408 TaxID=3155341 RepID=UPI0033A83404